MTFSGTLTMRQRHSPTNREEGGVGGDGKVLAAVKGKGEREKEDRKEQRMEGLLSSSSSFSQPALQLGGSIVPPPPYPLS